MASQFTMMNQSNVYQGKMVKSRGKIKNEDGREDEDEAQQSD